MPALPVIGAVAAVVGAGAAVYGTVQAGSAASKARSAQAQQFKFESQLASNRAAKERRDMIRAARVAKGNLVQGVENMGAGGTSAALGALGSIESQLSANLSFLDTSQKLSDQASVAAGQANIFTSKANTAQAIAGLGMQVFSSSGGLGAVEKVFKK